jgi:hypothetical protein
MQPSVAGDICLMALPTSHDITWPVKSLQTADLEVETGVYQGLLIYIKKIFDLNQSFVTFFYFNLLAFFAILLNK